MRKAMIVSSRFRTYAKSIEEGFKRTGHETFVVTSPPMAINKFSYLTRIKRKLGYDVSKYLNKLRSAFSASVVQQFDLIMPDIVYIQLGNMLTAEDVEYMSRHAVMVLYLSDPIKSVRGIIECLPYYDLVYTYEKTDIPFIQEKTDKPVKPMFGLFSEEEYFKTSTKKDIDVYFVGAIYPFRAELIIRLIKDFPRLNFEVDGNYEMFNESRKMIKSAPRDIRHRFSNVNITPEVVNMKYNRSKICLNLQHPQTQDGWNSRLTEILGSGSFEIVTGNSSVNEYFQNFLETFTSYEELKQKINYYIYNEEERESIANKGHTIALEMYTYSSGFQNIIEDITTAGLWTH